MRSYLNTDRSNPRYYSTNAYRIKYGQNVALKNFVLDLKGRKNERLQEEQGPFNLGLVKTNVYSNKKKWAYDQHFQSSYAKDITNETNHYKNIN